MQTLKVTGRESSCIPASRAVPGLKAVPLADEQRRAPAEQGLSVSMLITSLPVEMEAACTAHTLTAPTARTSAMPTSVHIWPTRPTTTGITLATVLRQQHTRPWPAIIPVTGISAAPRRTFSLLFALQRRGRPASSCADAAKWPRKNRRRLIIIIWRCTLRADNPTLRIHLIRMGFLRGAYTKDSCTPQTAQGIYALDRGKMKLLCSAGGKPGETGCVLASSCQKSTNVSFSGIKTKTF